MSLPRRAVYLEDAPAAAPQYLEVGLLEVAEDAGKREVSGLALPYGEDLERMDWLSGATKQRFAPKAAKVRDNAALFYGHDHLTKGLPIGRITQATHTDAGLKITAKISATAKGDEVYTLLRDGVLDRFSVGFYGGKAHLEDDDTVLVHDEVDVFEVSVVPDPAFKSATVDKVLGHNPNPPQQKEPVMPCSTCGKVHAPGVTECQIDPSTLAKAEDVTALSASVEDLTRKIATLGNGEPGGPSGPAVPGSSYGEFLQMVANGDKEAVDFLAYVGGTTDDLGPLMRDTWVGDRYKFIEAQRTTLNFFSRSPLPPTGLGVEYGIEGTDTTQVEEQVNEGDTLAYGKITFDTANAKLKTFGGWGEMSFQQIQRSPLNIIERYFASLLRRYAQTTEAEVATMALAGGTALAGGVLDLATSDGWTRFVLRASTVLRDRGYPLEAILVGSDVFEDLALLRDGDSTDGPRFLDRTTGRINITGPSGDLFGVPVIPISTGLTTDVVRAVNSEAIRTYEAPGAPFRLQDDDITKLTHAASVYGYMATVSEVPGASVKPATV